MNQHFFRDLEQLKKDLLYMGALVEEAIRQAIAALCDRRGDLVEEVLRGDRRIDHQETHIEEVSLHVLALHQPVARDLRFILTVMKVCNELERMGDHAKNIAEAAEFLCDHDPLPVYRDLQSMSQSTLDMVTRSLDALVNLDTELARHVREQDDVVDNAYAATLQHLSEAMQSDPAVVERGLRALNAARNLERVADIATNIAKDVIFLVEGEIVRHRGDEQPAAR